MMSAADRDLALGFGQRFALLQRHQAGDVVSTFAQQGGRGAHQFAALGGRRVAPDLEALFGAASASSRSAMVARATLPITLPSAGLCTVEGGTRRARGAIRC
jgi:hypothetical protein